MARASASEFFTDDDRIIFDSVIIITDRQILDKQLQDTVKQFEKTAGLVQKIDKNTKQLLKALATAPRSSSARSRSLAGCGTSSADPKS